MSLEIPQEMKELKALPKWYKLFFINDLHAECDIFDVLRREENIENLKAQLEKWDVWQKAMRDSGEEDFSFDEIQWNYQLKRAENLIIQSERALHDSEILSKNDFFKLIQTEKEIDPNWQYAAYLLLKKAERKSLQQEKIKVLLETGDRKNGVLCDLTINLHDGGNGKIYPNPKQNSLFNYANDFLKSIEQVWEHLTEKFAVFDKENSLSKIDASFEITFKINQAAIMKSQFLWGIAGPSAAAAIYLCLFRAITEYLGKTSIFVLDNVYFAVTAAMNLSKNTRLLGVGGISNKIQKAISGGMAKIFVAEENRIEAENALRENPDERARKAQIIACEIIEDVIKYLANEVKEKKAVIENEHRGFEKIKWLDKNVPIGENFQMMPMLITVKHSDLPHEINKNPHNGKQDESRKLRKKTVGHWEENLLKEKYLMLESSHSPEEVLTNFQKVLGNENLPDNFAGDTPRFVLLGGPGAGKSTFCKYLAWGCNKNELRGGDQTIWKLTTKDDIRFVPAHINLTDWEKEIAANSALKDLHFYLETKFRSLPHRPMKEHWKNWLERGEVLLLLDGLDEISGQLYEPLKNALQIFQNCPTVVTCRTVSFETHQEVLPDFPVFTLGGLTAAQQEYFLTAYLEELNETEIPVLIDWINSSNLQTLAANPLILSIICFVLSKMLKDSEKINRSADESQIDSIGKNLPFTRTALYHAAINNLLISENRESRRDASVKLSDFLKEPTEKLSLLKPVSLNLWRKNDKRTLVFSKKDLLSVLKNQYVENIYSEFSRKFGNEATQSSDFVFKLTAENEKYEEIVQNLFDDLSRVCGIFVGGKSPADSSNDSFYSFLHLTIHEFLAASALAQNFPAAEKINIFDLIEEKNLYDVNWTEVLAMLGGTLAIFDDTENLLEPDASSADSKKRFSPRVEAYVNALIEENERDIFYRPFFTAVAAAIEAGDKIKTETREMLFEKSMDLYFNPPDYLENEYFMPLIRLWNYDAIEFLKVRLGRMLEPLLI